MKQTLTVTNIGKLSVGDEVNLEKAMLVSDRLGGHIVQGHVDALATVAAINEGADWYELIFTVPTNYLKYIQPQGSITLNGVSLTVAKLDDTKAQLSVWLIPETLKRTNLGKLKVGDPVNLEVDVLAKYVERIMKAGEK
jgi:riboflavin synthase